MWNWVWVVGACGGVETTAIHYRYNSMDIILGLLIEHRLGQNQPQYRPESGIGGSHLSIAGIDRNEGG